MVPMFWEWAVRVRDGGEDGEIREMFSGRQIWSGPGDLELLGPPDMRTCLAWLRSEGVPIGQIESEYRRAQ